MKKILCIALALLSGQYLFSQTTTSEFKYLAKVKYNAIVAESNNSAIGTTVKKIVIDGFDSRIPFYHITPKSQENNKFVILLHGFTGSKNGWIYPMTSLSKKYIAIKDSLLARDYTVIIPDAKYHGERSYETDFVSPLILAQNQDVQKLRDLFSTTVKDVRILMDYIQSNSKNSASTFDVIGYSMGGMLTILLNSADNRINRTVVCVPPLNLQKAGTLIGLNEVNAEKLIDISPNQYASLLKAPIYLLAGNKDGWYTTKEMEDFFDEIPVEEKLLKFYDSGHYLPNDFIKDVLEGILKE